MTLRSALGSLSLIGVASGWVGCWKADVYPVTSAITGDAGGDADGLACSQGALPAGDSNVTLQVGSTVRTYVLHVPSRYDGKIPVPLVVDFHGIGSSGWGERSSSTFPPVTDQDSALIAFPDGMKGPVGTGWNMGPCCVEGVDDFSFTKALVADIRKKACIDQHRIYAVGVLTGGGMVQALACNQADLFAGVSPAGFDLLQESVDACQPSRPITVVMFRGTAAERVPYAGGATNLVPGMNITFLGAEATFQKWAQLNVCSGSPSAADSKGCRTYASCKGGVEVVLCTKQGGTDEPGDASVAWPVLQRHPL